MRTMRHTTGDYELFRQRLANVRVLAMDVDGVLTDGGILYSSDGIEQKRFHVADGLGLTVLQQLGVSVLWITGRESPIVTRRAKELQISGVLQGVRDKGAVLIEFSREQAIPLEDIAYAGDDWNDLTAFHVAGVRIAVANAVPEVLSAADAVTELSGGNGAVREICEAILEARGERGACVQNYLNTLRSSPNAPGLPQ